MISMHTGMFRGNGQVQKRIPITFGNNPEKEGNLAASLASHHRSIHPDDKSVTAVDLARTVRDTPNLPLSKLDAPHRQRVIQAALGQLNDVNEDVDATLPPMSQLVDEALADLDDD